MPTPRSIEPARSAAAVRVANTVSDTDERLWARCRAGDEGAWHELVRRHLPDMLGLALRFTGRRAAAEGVAHEVFLKLQRSLDAHEPAGSSFLAGLTARARSRAIEEFRTHRGRELDVPGGLGTALASLGAELREPVVLCDLQGASHDEASAALDIPLGTLKSRLNRARLELARRLCGRA